MYYKMPAAASSNKKPRRAFVNRLNEPALEWLATGWPDDQLLVRKTRASNARVSHQTVRLSRKSRQAAVHMADFSDASPFEDLTERERQVFRYIALGKPNKVAAIELGVSERTVEAHRARIFEKMRVRNAVELVRCTTAFVLTQGRSSRFWQLIGVEPTGFELPEADEPEAPSSS